MRCIRGQSDDPLGDDSSICASDLRLRREWGATRCHRRSVDVRGGRLEEHWEGGGAYRSTTREGGRLQEHEALRGAPAQRAPGALPMH